MKLSILYWVLLSAFLFYSHQSFLWLVASVAPSVITFLFYGWDKYQASRSNWRLKERTLHFLAFIGGWPGALAGRSLLRHKTQKASFYRVLFTIVFFHWVATFSVIGYWIWLSVS
ncbi:hypothetical protein VIBNISFn118_610016 [Vibrio nigripulchritudo SFn118]|nr:hypothetical protein VIBNISFn118_610016 [Vibrio nigripulchritudo SFn118]